MNGLSKVSPEESVECADAGCNKGSTESLIFDVHGEYDGKAFDADIVKSCVDDGDSSVSKTLSMCKVKSNAQRDAMVPGVQDNWGIADSLGEDITKECSNCQTISWGSDNEHTSGAGDFSIGVTQSKHSHKFLFQERGDTSPPPCTY